MAPSSAQEECDFESIGRIAVQGSEQIGPLERSTERRERRGMGREGPFWKGTEHMIVGVAGGVKKEEPEDQIIFPIHIPSQKVIGPSWRLHK